ncbi:MAG: aldo/keto reductase [Burkholderiales bacterium]
MQTTRIAGTGLTLSRLAFGCAPVMGRVGRAAALRAMETAFDLGVTHFDVARSYGYGDAEAVLGAFAAGKRDRITIATKFGIRTSARARGLRWLKPAVRQIARHIPYARATVRAISGKTLVAGHYGLADARTSVEESLRQLRTDYADILLLHDCSPTDELRDEMLGYLQDLVKIGRIKAWGIATRPEWISPLCASLPVKPMIIQCGRDLIHPGRAAEDSHSGISTIYHSPFGSAGAPADFRQILAATALPSVLADIAQQISTPAATARLLLEGAYFLAAGHPVLCSMFEPAHIRDNVDALERPVFTPAQLSALIDLFRARSLDGWR